MKGWETILTFMISYENIPNCGKREKKETYDLTLGLDLCFLGMVEGPQSGFCPSMQGRQPFGNTSKKRGWAFDECECLSSILKWLCLLKSLFGVLS